MLTAYDNNGHYILKLTEDLMMLSSNEFLDDFKLNLSKNPENVSFNFGSVQFIDSSGIGALVKCVNELKSKGIETTVFNLNKSLYSVFKLSGLYNLMKIYKEIDEFKKDFPDITSGLEE